MLLKFLSTSRYLILKGEMKKTLMPLTSLQEQVHGKMDTAASHPRRLSVRLEPLPGARGFSGFKGLTEKTAKSKIGTSKKWEVC